MAIRSWGLENPEARARVADRNCRSPAARYTQVWVRLAELVRRLVSKTGAKRETMKLGQGPQPRLSGRPSSRNTGRNATPEASIHRLLAALSHTTISRSAATAGRESCTLGICGSFSSNTGQDRAVVFMDGRHSTLRWTRNGRSICWCINKKGNIRSRCERNKK